MRSLLFGLMLLLASESASGQDQVKTWIFLTDKIDYTGKHTVAAPNQISARAQQRMEIRGNPLKAAQITRQDAPVAIRYKEALSDLGIRIEHTSRWLNAVTAWLTEDELSQVASLPFVRETRPVAHMTTMVEPSQSLPLSFAPRLSRNCTGFGAYGLSCHQLDVVNAIPVLERGINGEGVHIGFVDTYFGSSAPFDHPVFQRLRDSDRIGGHKDFTNRDATQLCLGHSDRHGQTVASIAVGYLEGGPIGPAHGATVWGAVTECAWYQRNIEEDNFVVGTEWLVDQGVDIINSSLGYTTFDLDQHSYTVADLDGDTGITTRIFDWAVERGVVTVSSAGDSGTDPIWPYISMPADGDSVIAVGGVTIFGGYANNSRGPTADGRIKPDVSALSGQVWAITEYNGYNASSGTSFSAPMISGVIAQILQADSTLKPREVWELLTSTASQSRFPDNRLGWGVVDADAAVQRALRVNIESHESPNQPDRIAHTLYPNPFSGATMLRLSLAQPASDARLILYNLIGQEVARPFAGHLSAGSHEIEINAGRLTPGIFLYVLETKQSRDTGTLIVLR